MTDKRSKRSRFPLPSVIDPAQRKCFTINVPDDIIHIGNFFGALQKLAQTGAYENDTAKTAKQVSYVWLQILEDAREQWLNGECGGDLEEGDCTGYGNCSGLIQWFPQNPCTQPDYVPSGYILPPWFIVSNEAIPITAGARAGDVWTDLTRLFDPLNPFPDPDSGAPHLRFTFYNPIEQDITVECHFVKVPTHGYALISQDSSLLPLPELLNLDRNVTAVPPETNIETVVERTFINASVGEHWIDIGVLPYIDDTLTIPLRYGMCFRKFVLCGKDFSIPVPELQFTDCTIRFRPSSSAAWQEYDITNCVQSKIDETIQRLRERGEIGGSQREPDGDTEVGFCKTFTVTLRSNGRWIAPIPIRANYTVKITNAKGGAFDGDGVIWYCPNGNVYALGACTSDDVPAEPGDPLNTQNHMRLIMKYNGVYHDAYNLTHNVSSSLVGAHDLEFQVNDGNLADNSGDYTFDVEICNYGACVPVFLPEDKRTVSVDEGVFTCSVHTANPDSNGAYQVVGFVGGGECECRKLEIISLTDYTLPGEPNNFNGGSITKCLGGLIVNEKIIGQNWKTFYESQSASDQCIQQFDIKSVTPFTMVFRVIDC